MLLAEELLLLLTKRTTSRSPFHSGTHAALAAAVLVELAEIDQLTTADGWVTIHPGDRHPLVPDFNGASVERAVLHTGIGLYPVLLARLTDQGVLAPGTRLGRPVWRLADRPRRDALVTELAAVLADDVPPTTRTTTLLGLLHTLKLLEFVFPVTPDVDVSRAARFAEGPWPVHAFTATVADCERSGADLPGVLLLDNRRKWALRPSEPPSPSR